VNQQKFNRPRPNEYDHMPIKHVTQVIKKEGIRIQLSELIDLGQKLERGVKHATVVQK
jgi:hypothetical protein